MLRNVWTGLGILLLATAVLAVTIAGPGSTPAAKAVQPRTLDQMVISASAFYPREDGLDYYNDGYELAMTTGAGTFVAPVQFDRPRVSVRKVTLYAFDNNAAKDVCVSMYRTTPSAAAEQQMAEACSSGASLTKPVPYTDSTVDNRVVRQSHSPYLWLYLSDSSQIAMYGVRIIFGY